MSFLERVSFNHATFGPTASFRTFLETVVETGAGGVGVWTERLDGLSPAAAGELIRDHGLAISGVNRGGFFTGSTTEQRNAAIDQTLRQIEATAELQADTLVIVPGGLQPDMKDIRVARDQVKEGIARVAPFARDHGVRLAIEPFHPALSALRGVVNTLDLALDVCDVHGEHVGVVTDIFHLWWDPGVYQAIGRAGSRIFGHHLCDWKLDAVDPVADRGVMGDGVADIPGITAAVMNTGYSGWMEIEIFSKDDLWTMEPSAIASRCLGPARVCLEEAEMLRKI
ncbi:sugar phosphate isomerase/epimerase family protein [Mesorhizobium sp. B4-1-1]|uniref:sugar phosphate isomerase/epimerase family protein n=1 Tax=Mesorhizobium sp. B4-1-1 TaxID=2589890 RepID=UPI0015E3B886|nr:sugar phosphate isomerase/epimerase family protein [Mesorhizobium sp. B4-1-1]